MKNSRLQNLQPVYEDRVEKSIYESIEKIAGLSPLFGDNEAIGFDEKGKLVHLKGITVSEISVKKSVRILRKIDDKFCDEDCRGDWSEDNRAKGRWLRMVEKALK